MLSKGSHIDRTMFRTPFACNLIESVAVFGSDRPDEECTLIHDRQGSLEELLVHRIFVVTPKMGAIPGSASFDATIAPSRSASEDIVLHSYHPTFCATLHFLCELIPRRIAARSAKVDDVIEERQVHLREVCWVGRPIVHLHIDVRMNVAMPERRVAAVVPNALQIRRRMNRCVEVRANCEVATILEIECFEEESVATLLVLLGSVVKLDEVFCRHRRRTAELQVNAIHQSTMRSLVVGEERCVALLRSCTYARGYCLR